MMIYLSITYARCLCDKSLEIINKRETLVRLRGFLGPKVLLR